MNAARLVRRLIPESVAGTFPYKYVRQRLRRGVAADWTHPFETLQRRWGVVPGGDVQVSSADLLQLSDADLLVAWRRMRDEVTTGDDFSHRGWLHELYAESLRGRTLVDVGCGLGLDGLTYAEHGAAVDFVDLHPSNLELVQRVSRLLGLPQTRYILLEHLANLRQLSDTYDVVLAMGSLHHAPAAVMAPEIRELVHRLRVGGRWLQLAYPRSRWVRNGMPSFDVWGQITDGAGTPWAEWYDMEKLLGMLAPATFEVVLTKEFHHREFIWFDLLRTA